MNERTESSRLLLAAAALNYAAALRDDPHGDGGASAAWDLDLAVTNHGASYPEAAEALRATYEDERDSDEAADEAEAAARQLLG